MWSIQGSHEGHSKSLNLGVGVIITHRSEETRKVYQFIFGVITERLNSSGTCGNILYFTGSMRQIGCLPMVLTLLYVSSHLKTELILVSLRACFSHGGQQ